MPSDPHLYDEPVGLLKIGTITSFNSSTGLMEVKLVNSTILGPNTPPIIVPITYPFTSRGGLFIGAKPVPGTPVIVGQSSGNRHFFVSFLPENLAQVPKLNDHELLLYANYQTRLSLNKQNNDISIGSVNNKIYINTEANLYTTHFSNEHHFTESGREINGLIKRDRKIYKKFDLDNRIYNDEYDLKPTSYTVISLDPTLSPNSLVSGIEKNPPFVENRELVYEFQDSSDVKDDVTESLGYKTSGIENTVYLQANRRKSKADTLSLTLAYPNYLIETVKGTVVDIFGNILDINRAPLPIGKDQNTLNPNISTDKSDSYLKIRALDRKSVAFHFELNARKDLQNQSGEFANLEGPEDVPSNAANNKSDLFGYDNKFPNSDYGRLRSRFFLDIDKEGQFKLNVPASSEVGNIGLLTRYENYSTISPDDNNNPNKLLPNSDLLDILQDSFAVPKLDLSKFLYGSDPGSINVVDSDNAEATPQDRRYANVHIKHGTAYHDILSTCYSHQSKDFISYQYSAQDNPYIKIDDIPLLSSVASDKIIVSGLDANAGGRSGAINFDGSIEMNVGANTVDRQSLWLDTAGGMVANIGRDKNNRSAVMSMNGDVLIQIGGIGVVGDSRFVKQINGQIGAVLDLRIFNSALTVTMIRVDDNGVTLMTPGNLNIYSSKQIQISGTGLNIDVENCIIQGRVVNKGNLLDSI
jgi:hypothetical protein